MMSILVHVHEMNENTLTDSSEKTTAKTTNSRAIPSVEAATLKKFRAFRAFRGQKIGCGR